MAGIGSGLSSGRTSGRGSASRGGAGTALVGAPEQIAERLREYQSCRRYLVLSGYPHLEESIRFAELVFPAPGQGQQTQRGNQTGGAFDIRVTRQAAGQLRWISPLWGAGGGLYCLGPGLWNGEGLTAEII